MQRFTGEAPEVVARADLLDLRALCVNRHASAPRAPCLDDAVVDQTLHYVLDRLHDDARLPAQFFELLEVVHLLLRRPARTRVRPPAHARNRRPQAHSRELRPHRLLHDLLHDGALLVHGHPMLALRHARESSRAARRARAANLASIFARHPLPTGSVRVTASPSSAVTQSTVCEPPHTAAACLCPLPLLVDHRRVMMSRPGRDVGIASAASTFALLKALGPGDAVRRRAGMGPSSCASARTGPAPLHARRNARRAETEHARSHYGLDGDREAEAARSVTTTSPAGTLYAYRQAAVAYSVVDPGPRAARCARSRARCVFWEDHDAAVNRGRCEERCAVRVQGVRRWRGAAAEGLALKRRRRHQPLASQTRAAPAHTRRNYCTATTGLRLAVRCRGAACGVVQVGGPRALPGSGGVCGGHGSRRQCRSSRSPVRHTLLAMLFLRNAPSHRRPRQRRCWRRSRYAPGETSRSHLHDVTGGL